MSKQYDDVLEEMAEEMINQFQPGPVVIPLSLARWVVNAEAITPADLEKARESLRRPACGVRRRGGW